MAKGGFRFRKSFKVAPGVRVNVGKKSMGVSAGTKGFSVSANTKTGIKSSVGIPGTGMRYEQKISQGQVKLNSQHNSIVQEAEIGYMNDLYVQDARVQCENVKTGVQKPNGAKLYAGFKSIYPQLKAPLSFVRPALAVGIIVSLMGQVWGWFVLGFGIIGLIYNSSLGKYNRQIIINEMDQTIAGIEEIVRQDQERAKVVQEYFTLTGHAPEEFAPTSVPIILSQSEKALIKVEAIRLNPDESGLRRIDHGSLIVTDKNIYFLGSNSSETIALHRVLQLSVEIGSVLNIAVKNRRHLYYEIPANAATTGAMILSGSLSNQV